MLKEQAQSSCLRTTGPAGKEPAQLVGLSLPPVNTSSKAALHTHRNLNFNVLFITSDTPLSCTLD